MQALSSRHPIQERIAAALRVRTSKVQHRSNLESIFQQFPELTEKIENIEPFIRPPWWTPKTQAQISVSKNEAKAQHNRQKTPDTLIIYTDGSGIDTKIGASACDIDHDRTSVQHLGNDSQFNVFAAELTAMNLALTMAQETNEHIQLWNVYTDSQAAIQAVDKPRRQSGQSIIKQFLDIVDEATDNNPHLQIMITWIPGHSEIEGNEKADKEAKKAAKNSTAGRLFTHRPLRSARAMRIKTEAQKQWLNVWNSNTTTAHALRRITKTEGSKVGTKFYNRFSNRKSATTLARLRTGHCGLKQYQYRFNLVDSPFCECGEGKETVEHYLLECILHAAARNELRKKVTIGEMRLDLLLGDPKLAKHTVDFVATTKGLDI